MAVQQGLPNRNDHNPKVGGSNPPPATKNATAEMEWRSPLLQIVDSQKHSPRFSSQMQLPYVSLEKFVGRDWKFAESFSGGMVDCIHNGGAGSGDSDFADAPHTQRI